MIGLLLLACVDDTVVFEGNIAPSAALMVPLDQGGLREAPTLSFSALIADDRDEPSDLELTWSWAGEALEGQAHLIGDIASVTLDSPGVGDHEVWIELRDSDGATGGAKARFTLSLPEDADLDGDGFIDAAFGGLDCDDTDDAIGPGQEEVCDGVDQDCDGQIDEGLMVQWSPDTDGDGFGDPTWVVEACDRPSLTSVSQGGDCDDTDDTVHPDAPEVCDGVDQDCDGSVDEGQGWFADDDRDGWGDSLRSLDACEPSSGGALNDADCDDTNPEQRYCVSCRVLDARGEVHEGLNTLQTSEGAAYDALCDGGWTLLGTNTRSGAWTPANVADDTEFGPPSATADFKGPAWNHAPFQDIRFVNDVEYAQYDGVGDGRLTWYAFQAQVETANCGINTDFEYPLTAGSVSGAALCSTNLYVHPSGWTYGVTCNHRGPGFGPTWNTANTASGSGCEFALPHASGFVNDDLGINPFGADEGPLQMWVR